MDGSSLIWLIVIVLVALVCGAAVWLYSDYQAGRKRARASRGQAEPRVAAPPVAPPPELPPPEPVPRIDFGPTKDLASPIQFGEAQVVPPAGAQVAPAADARTCPVCRRSVSADEYAADRMIICPDCRTHVHVECWEYSSNRCPNCDR
jgi:hypothetical protein